MFYVTGERFCPGVGQVSVTDEIKREIIHQLSIRPMAHSELVKALPEDVSVCLSLIGRFSPMLKCDECIAHDVS